MKGQGLAKILAEENCKLLEVNFVGINAENIQVSEDRGSDNLKVSPHLADCEWYSHIIYFLQNLSVPSDLTKT